MGELAVLAERLAVVGDDDDERVIEHARGAERADQAADERVDAGDFAGVRRGGVTRAERLGRIVGSMGVVEVDPGEERSGARSTEPGERTLDHRRTRALGFERRLAGAARNHVVVDREAAPEPESMVEHEGADERAGVIARVVKAGGERRQRVGKRSAAVLMHAVVDGQHPGKQCRVGWKGERSCRGDGVESDARLGDGVEARSFGSLGAVAAEVIRAQGVERHQQDVRAGCLRRARARCNEQQAGGENVPREERHACRMSRGEQTTCQRTIFWMVA